MLMSLSVNARQTHQISLFFSRSFTRWAESWVFSAVNSTRYLGGEVSVKDALAVQVVKPSGNVQGQTDSGAPRQVEVTVQQLLQVSSIYILQRQEDWPT